MKKTFITITAIMLCVGYGVLSWDLVTHSEPPGPEDSPFANDCIEPRSSDLDATAYDKCCIDYSEALAAAKRDWQFNLQQIASQERPASDMVEDAYENLRTYNCWVEYICRAVQYSGHAPVESALGTGLKAVHIGQVPGCEIPDNLRMESEYNQFVQDLKDVPILGYMVEKAGGGYEAIEYEFESIMVENKINYFPRCQTDDAHNNRSPDIAKVKAQYDACKKVLAYEFQCSEYTDPELCIAESRAFATLDKVLKERAADQKASALERKLGTIVSKLHTMESHVGYLDNFLTQLDQRFKCYAAKCD